MKKKVLLVLSIIFISLIISIPLLAREELVAHEMDYKSVLVYSDIDEAYNMPVDNISPVMDILNTEGIPSDMPIRRTSPPNQYRTDDVSFDHMVISRGIDVFRTTQDLTEISSLVVRGTVTGSSYPFIVEYACGNRAIRTEYYITVHEVLRGETSAQEVTIRLRGGTIGNFRYVVTFNPDFVIGTEYILFLVAPLSDYYYYLVGGSQGVFVASTGPVGVDGDTVSFARYGDVATARSGNTNNVQCTMVLADLRAEIEAINSIIPIPTREYMLQQQVNALIANLESGFLCMTDDELSAEIYEIMSRPNNYSTRVVRSAYQ